MMATSSQCVRSLINNNTHHRSKVLIWNIVNNGIRYGNINKCYGYLNSENHADNIGAFIFRIQSSLRNVERKHATTQCILYRNTKASQRSIVVTLLLRMATICSDHPPPTMLKCDNCNFIYLL